MRDGSRSIARDQYVWDLQCPICGQVGIARVSEEAFPYILGLRFAVEEVSEDFQVRTLGKSASDTDIECLKCNVLAVDTQ